MKTTFSMLVLAASVLAAFPTTNAQAAPIDNWHIRDSGTLKTLDGVAFGNGRFVAVGEDGVVLTSTDGAAWNPSPSPSTNSLRDVVFGNGLFVTFSGASLTMFHTSPDGATWTTRPITNSAGHISATFDGTRFFVINGKGSFQTSTDGIDWTRGTINGGNLDPACVVGHGGQWVVAGYKTGNNNKGMLFSAPDLVDWDARDSQLANNLFGAGYINGTWVVAGQGGVLASSPDGVNWTPRNSQTTGFIWDFASNGGYLVGASQWGRMIYSQNGIDWTRVQTDLPGHMKSVTFGNGTFVSVGWDGQVLQSDPMPGTGGNESAPTLTIQKKGGWEVIVSWPLSATGWTLQRSSNLKTWVNEPMPVVDTATMHTVTLDCAGANLFRLRK